MKKIHLFVLLFFIVNLLFPQAQDYHTQFQAAFLKLINAADDYFEGLYYEDRNVNDDPTLHELKIDFPEEYEFTFYRRDYRPGKTIADPPKSVTYKIQIDYNTEDENSPLANYGIMENDRDKMNDCYQKILNEMKYIINNNIGEGDWLEINSKRHLFFMVSTTDKYPQISIKIDASELLGIKLIFTMEEILS